MKETNLLQWNENALGTLNWKTRDIALLEAHEKLFQEHE